MRSPLIRSTALLLAALPSLTGCINLRVGADKEFFRMEGLANVHGTFGAQRSWDGNFLDVGLFTNTRGRGEILSIEIGPLAGLGVGLVGARARVLSLEVGAGTLFYNPRGRRKDQDSEHYSDSDRDGDGVDPQRARWPDEDEEPIESPERPVESTEAAAKPASDDDSPSAP